MLRAVASLVAPPLCGICGAPCDAREEICLRCARGLGALEPIRTNLPGGLEAVSAAPYDGVARDLVAKLKFSARLPLAEIAAERMARARGAATRGWLVPVPPAPARQRNRGYDIAHLLAAQVARRTLDARACALLARDDGPRQVGRPRAERLADPPGFHLLGAGTALPAGELWLVDDVLTTGATLLACAAVLRAAGAMRVRALTFARADSFGPRAQAA